MSSREKPRGKVSEQMAAYKTREVTFSSNAPRSVGPALPPSQLRRLPRRERNRLLTLQAKHAASMFARVKEEIIGDVSDLIEY
jgi:hypothetical protein